MTATVRVNCHSKLTLEGEERLTADRVQAWAAGLPPDAILSPIMREYGSQRDPVLVLFGLVATWTEER